MLLTEQLPPRDPRFIPQPSELCMLATKWDCTVPAGGLIVQEKIDGIRALWFDGQLWTREGTPILGVAHVTADLRAIERRAGEPLFLDGELQVDGTLAATTRHFRAAGRYGDAGLLHLFDALPLADWKADAYDLPLGARLQRLEHALGDERGASVRLLPSRLCGCAATVLAHAAAVWAHGGEGSVGKVAGSAYRRRRSSAWCKVKRVVGR